MGEYEELAPDTGVETGDLSDDAIQADGIAAEEATPSDESIRANAEVELERLKKQMREFQARADRAEAELKQLRRQGMDETERLRDELAEKEAELREYQAMVTQLVAEKERAEVIREFGIPADFEKFVPFSYDRMEMREAARELSQKLQQLTKQAERLPRTGAGAPTIEVGIDQAIKSAIEKGDVREALKAKLIKLRGG